MNSVPPTIINKLDLDQQKLSLLRAARCALRAARCAEKETGVLISDVQKGLDLIETKNKNPSVSSEVKSIIEKVDTFETKSNK